MKTKLLLLTLILCVGIFSCDSDDEVTDPIVEFVSFRGNSSVNLNEFNNSTEAYPLVIQLWAFEPYAEDIEMTFEVTGTNVLEGDDFTLTPSNFKIRAGHITDTLWIKTVDNAAGTNEEKTFEVRIKTISKPDIKIGLGVTEPADVAVSFSIQDDECSETTAIFTNPNLVNLLDWGYEEDDWDEEDVDLSATGVTTGDQVTIHGDLIYYGSLYPAGNTITLTLTPDSPGATKGKATFGEKVLGTATDGWDYRIVEIGQGRYDVCSGTINVEFDFQYLDGANWEHSYYVRSVYSIP